MYDLAVVGAGPAGAAAAIRATQLRPNARVLLLDRDDFPRDKPCGDGISAASVVELSTLGALAAVAGRRPVHHLHVRAPSGQSVRRPSPQACYVVPRTEFDAALVAVARRSGAEVVRHRVRSLTRREREVVIDGELAARVVIAADGANSTVRRVLGLPAADPKHTAVAIRGYTTSGQDPDELLIALERTGSLAYAWAFPLDGGGANVGYGQLMSRARSEPDLTGPLHRLLPWVDTLDRLRGHRLPLASRPTPQPAGRILLAGDALSLINPITGEGIHHALRSGRLAAEVAIDGAVTDPGRAYARALRTQLGGHLRQAAVMARVCELPGFVDTALDVATRRTDVWTGICELGLGAGTVPSPTVARLLGLYARQALRGRETSSEPQTDRHRGGRAEPPV
jgi:geranylgeranyl reductase family protein